MVIKSQWTELGYNRRLNHVIKCADEQTFVLKIEKGNVVDCL